MKKLLKVIIVFDLVVLIVITAGVAGNLLNMERVTQVFHMLSPDREDTKEELKKVAITFDDGPNPDYTEQILDVLREKDVKATFFLLGSEVEKYPELVKKIYDEGHLIGNHSFKHEQLNKMTSAQACEQVNKTNQLIYDITGEYPQYLRPPFGEWKNDLDCQVNMINVMWDIDTLDWKNQNQGRIVENVMTKAKENDIILMHDGYDTTISATLQLIDMLREKGYEFVTVDELILE